jgi:HSP20 family molecular chaperone IbpA
LPNIVDRDGIVASINDGVLTLTLPRVKEATPRTIEIQ